MIVEAVSHIVHASLSHLEEGVHYLTLSAAEAGGLASCHAYVLFGRLMGVLCCVMAIGEITRDAGGS